MELASGGGRCDDFGCDGCFEVQFPELFKISDGKVKARWHFHNGWTRR